jgi:hypothetical protein
LIQLDCLSYMESADEALAGGTKFQFSFRLRTRALPHLRFGLPVQNPGGNRIGK